MFRLKVPPSKDQEELKLNEESLRKVDAETKRLRQLLEQGMNFQNALWQVKKEQKLGYKL